MNKVEDFYIAHVGAFMFKHIRAETNIHKFKQEFRCLRHGHYDELIERVRSYFPDVEMESPIIVAYDIGKGEPTTDKSTFNQRMMCDFVGIINCQKPMHHFAQLLVTEYGKIKDEEFETKVFQEVVLYELGLRNALCNAYKNNEWEHNLISSLRLEMEDVIDELAYIYNLTPENIDLLTKGRQFRNYVKEKKLRKNQFESSAQALIKFKEAITLAKQLEFSLYY